MRHRLLKHSIPCNQGRLYVYTTDGQSLDSVSNARDVVILHPGMGKSPRRFSELLYDLSQMGLCPVAIDTRSYRSPSGKTSSGKSKIRYAEQLRRRRMLRSVPFDQQPQIDSASNPYAQRRVEAVELCINYLRIDKCIMIGHSDGGRILTTVASNSPNLVSRLVLLNSAGAGNSWHAYRRLYLSNKYEILANASRPNSMARLSLSGSSSVAYFLKNPHRTLQEKRLIQHTNLWAQIDYLRSVGVDVDVLAAKEDWLVSFDDIKNAASRRPRLNFIATEGRHTNAYTKEISNLVTRIVGGSVT